MACHRGFCPAFVNVWDVSKVTGIKSIGSKRSEGEVNVLERKLDFRQTGRMCFWKL